MSASRKQVQTLISSLTYLRGRYQCLQEEIVSFSSNAEYTKIIRHYDKLIATLTDKLCTLPIGYKYTGVFYVKKPYCVVPEFQKCTGELFMREDLISWQITKGVGLPNQLYYKAAFKRPSEEAKITRADTVPVYNESKEATGVTA